MADQKKRKAPAAQRILTDEEFRSLQLKFSSPAQPKTHPKDPSTYCHICLGCSRGAKKYEYLICSNIRTRKCKKIICKKCIIKNKWDWEAATADPSSFKCCHCMNICPPNAHCNHYKKSNMKRTRKDAENETASIPGTSNAESLNTLASKAQSPSGGFDYASNVAAQSCTSRARSVNLQQPINDLISQGPSVNSYPDFLPRLLPTIPSTGHGHHSCSDYWLAEPSISRKVTGNDNFSYPDLKVRLEKNIQDLPASRVPDFGCSPSQNQDGKLSELNAFHLRKKSVQETNSRQVPCLDPFIVRHPLNQDPPQPEELSLTRKESMQETKSMGLPSLNSFRAIPPVISSKNFHTNPDNFTFPLTQAEQNLIRSENLGKDRSYLQKRNSIDSYNFGKISTGSDSFQKNLSMDSTNCGETIGARDLLQKMKSTESTSLGRSCGATNLLQKMKSMQSSNFSKYSHESNLQKMKSIDSMNFMRSLGPADMLQKMKSAESTFNFSGTKISKKLESIDIIMNDVIPTSVDVSHCIDEEPNVVNPGHTLKPDSTELAITSLCQPCDLPGDLCIGRIPVNQSISGIGGHGSKLNIPNLSRLPPAESSLTRITSSTSVRSRKFPSLPRLPPLKSTLELSEIVTPGAGSSNNSKNFPNEGKSVLKGNTSAHLYPINMVQSDRDAPPFEETIKIKLSGINFLDIPEIHDELSGVSPWMNDGNAALVIPNGVQYSKHTDGTKTKMQHSNEINDGTSTCLKTKVEPSQYAEENSPNGESDAALNSPKRRTQISVTDLISS